VLCAVSHEAEGRPGCAEKKRQNLSQMPDHEKAGSICLKTTDYPAGDYIAQAAVTSAYTNNDP